MGRSRHGKPDLGKYKDDRKGISQRRDYQFELISLLTTNGALTYEQGYLLKMRIVGHPSEKWKNKFKVMMSECGDNLEEMDKEYRLDS